MVPPCVRTYHNGQTFSEQQLSFVSDKAAVKKLLSPLQAKYKFVLQSDSAFAKEDQKSKNRKLRADRKRKHQAEKKHNDDRRERKKMKQSVHLSPPTPPPDVVD